MKKVFSVILAVLLIATVALTAGCDKAPTAFKAGTWATDSGTNYVFYEDGKGGSSFNAVDGMGIGFDYELEKNGDCVFHMGSVDDVTKAKVEFIGGGDDTAAITWEDGSRIVLYFVNDDTTGETAASYVMGQVTGEDDDVVSETADEAAAPAATATDPEAVIGNWHDSVAGRASMTVTMSDNNPYFEVEWPDSASTYYVYYFLCDAVDSEGRLVYTNGFTGRVDTDSEGNETKTIIDEEAQGTVELTADGTMIWVEASAADNPHEFAKD